MDSAATAWLLALTLVACSSDGDGNAPTCLISERTGEIAILNQERVDLLFVVEDSPSMAEEQARLARELPAILEALLRGERRDGTRTQPLRDVHIGVVSANLGAPSVVDVWEGCDGSGDDAVIGRPATCGAEPSFLRYRGEGAEHPLLATPESDAGVQALSADLECALGISAGGCPLAQPLEAALKALWPEIDRDGLDGRVHVPNRVRFAHGTGQGDRENGGFLRNDPSDGISLVGVYMVSDGDDCSLIDTEARAFADGLDAERFCAQHPDLLQPVSRYADALRALRPGNENLVLLGALTGVPPELVDDDARPDMPDEAAREAYYHAILQDPRMQIRSATLEGVTHLEPACSAGGVEARPGRRLVEAARLFGESGVVQSICQDDYTALVDPLVEVTSKVLGAACLPLEETRGSDGRVPCTLLWQLPAAALRDGDPTACAERNFLSPSPLRPVEGRQTCEVKQLRLTGEGEARELEAGEGWFYDDTVEPSAPHACQRFLWFTPAARPPPGASVLLSCLDVQPEGTDPDDCRVP
ncbi:MAG: hypothetical protein OXT09_07895 [Myxococcales bacterium]|nr:hypothetical protein [Myxococcales bacterium]